MKPLLGYEGGAALLLTFGPRLTGLLQGDAVVERVDIHRSMFP